MRNFKNIGPFCWAEKAALKKIGETFGETANEASARSVYLALCQLASDQQSDRFQIAVGTIAARSGVSTRSVHKVLSGLAKIDLLHIQQRTEAGMKVQSVYTLLPMRSENTSLGNNVISMRNEQQRPLVADTRTILEQSSEESSNKGISGLSFAEEARKAMQ